MKLLRRKHRILTTLAALFSMLFMQLAVAAYGCPDVEGAGGSERIATDRWDIEAMPGCDQPDPKAPALCHAHCIDGKASLDKPQAPSVSAVALIVFAVLIPLQPLVSADLPSTESSSFLQRITAPSISIRHCCFRI